MNWNASAFELMNANNLALENFYGNQQITNGKLAIMWSSEVPNGITLSDGSIVFELSFRVIGNSAQNQSFVFNSAITKAEAFNYQLEPLIINGYTASNIVIGNGLSVSDNPQNNYQLQQNMPNPFKDYTEIVFNLPNNERVTFNIYNTLGELVNQISGEFSSGINKISINAKDKSNNDLSNGTYYLQMRAGNYTAFRKMLILR